MKIKHVLRRYQHPQLPQMVSSTDLQEQRLRYCPCAKVQHSSAATTQRYIGIEPQRIEQAIQNHAQLL